MDEPLETSAAAALTQQDFRKMLLQPKTPGAPGNASSAKKAPVNEFAAAKQKQKKEMMKRIEEKKVEDALMAEKYRDRASERRQGQNKDYEEQDSLLSDFHPSYNPMAASEGGGNDMTTQIELRR